MAVALLPPAAIVLSSMKMEPYAKKLLVLSSLAQSIEPVVIEGRPHDMSIDLTPGTTSSGSLSLRQEFSENDRFTPRGLFHKTININFTARFTEVGAANLTKRWNSHTASTSLRSAQVCGAPFLSRGRPTQLCYRPRPSPRLLQGGEWACPHGARADAVALASASGAVHELTIALATKEHASRAWPVGRLRPTCHSLASDSIGTS